MFIRQTNFLLILAVIVLLVGLNSVLYNLDQMQFKTSKMVSTKVLLGYCPQPGSPQPIADKTVTVMKDANGNIGGYVVTILDLDSGVQQKPLLDSPVTYLDTDGNELTVSHIFNTPLQQTQAEKIIESLRKQFPIEEPLRCPQ
jgi:hypothetical protein